LTFQFIALYADLMACTSFFSFPHFVSFSTARSGLVL
jgi:hypothetical protein